MPQPDIAPYQPARRTETFVFRQGETDEDGEIQDDAPLVMTIRQSLTHGEIGPLREWFRALTPDPDEGPDEDDTSADANRERRRLARERTERNQNQAVWPRVAPFVLAWNAIDVDGQAIPPPCETGGGSFAHVPNEAFGAVLWHFLGIPQRRVDMARKPSSASARTDAPSPATSSPSGPGTTP